MKAPNPGTIGTAMQAPEAEFSTNARQLAQVAIDRSEGDSRLAAAILERLVAAAGFQIERTGLANLLRAEGQIDYDETGGLVEWGGLAWRTLADIDDSPPGELELGMYEPRAPNLIYAAGGVGKGSTCCYNIAEYKNRGIRSLIYDAESHPREWRRRTSGLGVPPGEIVYIQPHELPAHLLGRPLNEVIPHLGRIAKATQCGAIFIDSVLAGANLSEDGLRGDARAPYLTASALAELNITSILIGHTPKNNPAADHPYGSVSWTNATRLTWLGTQAEGEGHRVRWTPKKRNERGEISAMLLSFHYDANGQLRGVTKEDDERATRQWLMDALIAGPQTVEDLADELTETGDAAAAERAKERVRRTLNRMRHAGLVHKTGGRGSTWALGENVSRNGKRDREDR